MLVNKVAIQNDKCPKDILEKYMNRELELIELLDKI
jgi:hypothetical protein